MGLIPSSQGAGAGEFRRLLRFSSKYQMLRVMNLSLIVIEKIKSYFTLPASQFVSLANLAHTLEKDDFSFLADISNDQADSADQVTRFYASKYYFSHLANSLPNGNELVWNPDIDTENTLDKKFADVLKNVQLNRKNQSFVTRWLKADSEMQSETNVLTDPTTNVPFLDTSCTSSFYEKIDEPWTRITLSNAELASLDAAVRTKYADAIYTQIDPLMNGEKLDIQSISFEINLVGVQRNWFSQSLLQNSNWKMSGSDILSNGENCTEGALPAFTSSMIFIKNVEWELVAGTPNNVAVLTKLQEGALTFGSLPIQGIPQGVNLQLLKTIRSSVVKPAGYDIFNKNIQHRFNAGDLIFQQPTGAGQVITPIIPLTVHAHQFNKEDILGNQDMGQYDPFGKPGQVIFNEVNTIPTNVVKTFPMYKPSGLPTYGRPRGPEASGETKKGGDPEIPRWQIFKSREYFRYFPYVFAEVRPTAATYTVTGYVRAKGNNAPLKEALVTVLFGEGQRLTTLTDQNGWFSIAGVSKGGIVINIGKTNYGHFEETIQLDGNRNHNVLLEQVATLPPGTFFLFGVISTRLPKLPNPAPEGEYVALDEAVELNG